MAMLVAAKAATGAVPSGSLRVATFLRSNLLVARVSSMSRHLSSSPSNHQNTGDKPRPKAVIFDLGGVVLQPGPLPAIQNFGKTFATRTGVSSVSLSEVFKHATTSGTAPFARLERGEISLEDFYPLFQEAAEEKGLIGLDARQLFEDIHQSLKPSETMVDAIKCLRAEGFKVAAVTNNWRPQPVNAMEDLSKLFDVVIESAVVGMRKPEPGIYEAALSALGAQPHEAVFLDDIGANLKPAKEMGMTTIKVVPTKEAEAISQLEQLLGVPLQGYVPGTTHADPKDFGVNKLAVYLKDRLGLRDSDIAHPQLRSFSHGQSNPTFYLKLGSNELVIRKKPPGKLIPSAHAVEREYRITSALDALGLPVAKPLHLCEDESIVGTPFFVMQYTKGSIFKNPNLPGVAPDDRRRVYANIVHALASIHNVNFREAGLGDFAAKADHYMERQFKRWVGQYEKSKEAATSKGIDKDVVTVKALDQLAAQLNGQFPADADQSIVHGDFRLDNAILDSDTFEVKAVLDWELSTLGDPLCDLALLCLPYHVKGKRPPFLGVDSSVEGVPTEDELVEMYCKFRGIDNMLKTDSGRKTWDIYMSFTCFRVSAILQGVFVRSLGGQAASRDAQAVGAMSDILAQVGLWIVNGRHGESPISNTKAHHSSAERSPGPAQVKTQTRSQSTMARLEHGASREEREEFVASLRERLSQFMDTEVYPRESELARQASALGPERWQVHPGVEEMKQAAKAQGLWNLFMPVEADPEVRFGAGLTNEEYAGLCEIMGRSVWAPEAFNCSAPDTGNMEVLVRYGTAEQQKRFLQPLLDGECRSCFAMTEPSVASSDATNIQASIKRDGDEYILNGRKWWISGAMDPRCRVGIFMGRTDPDAPKHKQQSMILFEMDSPGLTIERPLSVLGFDDAPHGHAELVFDNVRVPASNLLLGEGRGFEIAQGRLGPGRIHHCMRLIGMAERALELMCQRVTSRTAFGTLLADKGGIRDAIAQSRLDIEQSRLLTMAAARKMDLEGNKAARRDIALIKIAAPAMAQRVIDRAMQAHGGGGLSQDFPLAHMFAWARVLRLADGPDEVHADSVARLELKPYLKKRQDA